MKKMLFVAASFVVLGALLMSPLYAMKREHEEGDVKEKKLLTVTQKGTNDTLEETKNTDCLFVNTEDIWVIIASLLDDKSQESFRFTSKFFYSRSEAMYKLKNGLSGHFQWAEFKMPERIVPKFNSLVIQYICSNLERLNDCPSSCDLGQYTKNYERLENFPGLPKKALFECFLQAQHLHLWKEKLAAEELVLPPKSGENSFYRAARQMEYESKLKNVNIALPVLEIELNKKKSELFKNNPFPLNLNEIALSYLSYLSKKLSDPEKAEPEKKPIAFELYLKELGHNLSDIQKECPIVKIFTDFKKVNDLETMNGIHDLSEDTDDSDDINEYPIDFAGFGEVKFNTLDL